MNTRLGNKSFIEILHDIRDKCFNLIDIASVYATADTLVGDIEKETQYRVVNNTEGKVSVLEDTGDARFWGKNNTPMPFHLDGAYYPHIPRYVLLYCVRASDQGGKTVFAQASKVIARLFETYDKKLLESINIIYIGTDRKKYRRPLIEKTENGDLFLNWYSSVYIEPDVQKMTNDHRRLFTQYTKTLVADIEKYIEESIIHIHEWQPGDAVIFDNRLLLHARKEMIEGGDRLLYRIWFDEPEFVEIKNPITD